MLLRPLRVPGLRRLARRAARGAGSGWRRGSRCPSRAAPTPRRIRDAFRARCGAWDRQRQFDAAYGFGVFLRDGERFAGEVSLGNVQRGPFQSAYVGYWIDEAAAGHGYIPEGVVLMLRYAFEELRLHRIEAAIVPRNAPSRRVADKLGLRDEGVAASSAADPRRVRGPRPVRDHRRGVGRAPRGARPRSS